ncbi:hypothetical protein HNR19_000950 [Nocardioides thalensis]|uniref:Histidine kinase/HSP90-like ATPase domain-containing protein n=1 Tax=Nocardioides thalensis TaxID=1914755 RepID=A0A853C0J6_9ACTN|nr:hypothetical protein [Nocardioides thalensis]NYJ00252.1 hypothetical protein [Nocardioides thalensis]
MDPAVRKSAANGIWLCNVHAREIDVDEKRFPEALLHRWKRRARQRAYAARGLQTEPPEPRALIRHTAWLGDATDRPIVHRFVADFMSDTGAQWLWPGDAYDAIRMALYELVLNAVEHGGADGVHLRARGFRIDLVYVGCDFNPNSLSMESGDGGAEAMLHLHSVLGDSLTVAYTHNGAVATIRLIDVGSAGPNQPCAIRSSDLVPGWEVAFEACDAVHVFVGGLMSFSDISSVGERLQHAASQKRLVVHGFSEPLAESAARRFPELSVVKRRKLADDQLPTS